MSKPCLLHTLTRNTRILKHLGQLKQKMQKLAPSVAAGFDQGKGKPRVPGRTFSTYHAKTWPSLGSHQVHRWWICCTCYPWCSVCGQRRPRACFWHNWRWHTHTHTNLQFTRHILATLATPTHTQDSSRFPKTQEEVEKDFTIFLLLYNLGLICSLLAAFIHNFLHLILFHDQNPFTLSLSMLLLALRERLNRFVLMVHKMHK